MKIKKIWKIPPIFLAAAIMGDLPAKAQIRHYYIAAEDVVWDFAPSGQNLVHCHKAAPCVIQEPWADSHQFPATRYIHILLKKSFLNKAELYEKFYHKQNQLLIGASIG